MIRVAINGFGRIGRLAFREMITGTIFDVVAINGTSSAEDLAYLLKYDSNHRRFHSDLIKAGDNCLVINDIKKVPVFTEKDPINLPWKELNVDLVLECTGKFTDVKDALKHVEAGAKKVLISAPAKGDCKTIVFGVNDNLLDKSEKVVSAASCTTNCLAPVLNVLEREFGIEKGFMSTIHAYTNDQVTLDGNHSKGYESRRGRAAAINIIPASTGAASAIGKVIPKLQGKMDGVAYRVPVADGSMIDLVLELKTNVSKEKINEAFLKYQSDVLQVTNDPIVSSDVLGVKCGALVDLRLTSVLEASNKHLVKVVAWYDNEVGYTAQMMRTAKMMF